MTTPERMRDALRRRADLYALIRRFFAERNVIEVETPILSASANTDPNIQSFATRFSGRGAGERWLRTSSEFAQKRLLVAGVGDCYELGRVFRDGEAGRRHNPEFTMLEWYRVGRDHRWLMDETVETDPRGAGRVGQTIQVSQIYISRIVHRWPSVSIHLRHIRYRFAFRAGRHCYRSDGLTRDDWLDLLLTHRIQPLFRAIASPLLSTILRRNARSRKVRWGEPPVAERFEVYVGSHELANGYHELTDADEQRRRFERDNERRRERGLPSVPIDENLLRGLEQGLPDCAGVALGIERLLMAMTGSDNIADVLAFPFAEA